MQIQLKQTEIITALKQFIAQQGFDLAGKSVDITFTAGRKENGISADIDISDLGIPTITGEPQAVCLSLVQAAPSLESPAVQPEVVSTNVTDLNAAASLSAEPVLETLGAVEAPAVKTTSLFNS